MMRRHVGPRRLHLLLSMACITSLAAGCEAPEREPFSFYDERIDPIVRTGCQRQTTGCHVDDGRGFALGNLDLSSYQSLMRRSDALEPYGPYSVGLLLLKAGDPIQVQVSTVDSPDPAQPERRYVSVTTDIRHGGGEGAIAQGSRDYSILKQWIDGGHTATGTEPRVEPVANLGDCVRGPGSLPHVELGSDPEDGESFARFLAQVQPVLVERCAGSNCHGTRTADLYLSCGQDAAEQRWNYQIALRYLDRQAVSSELLRRPMAKRAGGVFHEGGDVFRDTGESEYKQILEWAEDIAARRPDLLRFEPKADETGLRFFANRVQPVLVRKGCMFLGCHSPAMFHDLRLSGGARGAFSEVATRRNYEASRLMLALESSDPGHSRLVAKNLCSAESGGSGLKHRGGALLEDFGGCADAETRANPAQCSAVDADRGDLNQIPAYCVLARWHALERQAAIERGELSAEPGPRAIVWVGRPPGVGGPTEFDIHRPGADLLWADITLDAEGRLGVGAPRSLLSDCGLPPGIDVRSPAVSWDAKRIAFAARSAAASPLRIYEMNADGSQCGQVPGLAPAAVQQDGILLHDFEPAYAPDGRLVFASTRGYLDGESGLAGPTRTPAALQPNANLYVYSTGANPPVRQLTYLLDQELQPSFMRDGRLIYSVEKRGEDFHQLAGRRQNLDGGDYHPLFAQRNSVGFEVATEIEELPNRDFVMVAAGLGARDGGGTIVVVNRSIGPDQADRDPGDKSYIHALTTPVPGAFGGGSGVFRSPAPLPNGRVLASCDLTASDLSAGSPHYALCELDPAAHEAPRLLYRSESLVAIEAVAVYPRVQYGVYASRSDEPNGSTAIDASDSGAVVHYLDVPVLSSLLFSNTRTGRPIDGRVAGLEFFMPQPPPNSVATFAELGADVVSDAYGTFYQSLRSLGKAAMQADGSLRVHLPGGAPITVALTDDDGSALSFAAEAPLSGPMRQREAMQFYPGERTKQSMPRKLFDGLCAGCHGSISGRELDVHVEVDVLTSASRTFASDELRDLR
jgi:hypothetical protein